MKQPVFFTAGETDALRHACNQLTGWGYPVSTAPSEDITHLLLPVPSFDAPGVIKGGTPVQEVLSQLPENVTVLGGNLTGMTHRHVDFLKDEYYLNENAAITAHCTVRILLQHFSSLDNVQVLIIGWGRIGKHLINILQDMGAHVFAAVRKESDSEALKNLGCNAVYIHEWQPKEYQVIINTAPAPVMDQSETDPNTLLIDLASVKGIVGDGVIWARGLPNQMAPNQSGILIAKTALRYALGREHV